MSLTENILVLLKVNASVSTKLPGRDSEEGWNFPVMGTGQATLLQPCPTMQMCPRMAFGICPPVSGAGGVDPGPQVCSDYRSFCTTSSGSWLMALSRAGAANGRTRCTNLTFACQTSGVLSVAWPCTRPSFCTTAYEFSKEEKHSDYELSRRKQSPANK